MFPSPCGDYGSYLLGRYNYEKIWSYPGFRPLAGIMVLIATTYLKKSGTIASCFRPLAGIMVLIVHHVFREKIIFRKFPSPCGDYGSYRLKQNGISGWMNMKFPSPCGDYGSYHYLLGGFIMKEQKSFRPLAGIMVLITVWQNAGRLNRQGFPSPCGDYGSYLTI